MTTSSPKPLTPAVLHILLALATRERHGYGIMKQVQADSQGKVTMGPGTLYGSLGRMMEAGLIRECEQRVDPELDDERRVYYELTDSGRRALEAELERYRELVAVARSKALSPGALMPPDRARARYARAYGLLLRLYPESFRARFAEGMAQTFNDLCREREEAGERLFAFALRTFGETTVAMARERMSHLMRQKKAIIRLALVVAAILAIPLVAMQFSDGVDWSVADFMVAGVLLFGAGLAYELVARRSSQAAFRAAVALAVLAPFLLIWMNLAVGIIGSEGNPANALYFFVFAVELLGVILARWRPHGMARALFATAATQALVPVVALLVWKPQLGTDEALVDLVRVLVLNAFFVVLFVGSGLLFRQAGVTGQQRSRGLD